MARLPAYGRRRGRLAAPAHLNAPAPWRDPFYAVAFAAALPGVALIAAATPATLGWHWPGSRVFAMAVVVWPLLEEIVFRLGVHDAIASVWRARLGPLTGANTFTAGLFALAHLFTHPPAWALATALPALVFGAVWERHRQLAAPVGVHAFYNASYFCLLAF